MVVATVGPEQEPPLPLRLTKMCISGKIQPLAGRCQRLDISVGADKYQRVLVVGRNVDVVPHIESDIIGTDYSGGLYKHLRMRPTILPLTHFEANDSALIGVGDKHVPAVKCDAVGPIAAGRAAWVQQRTLEPHLCFAGLGYFPDFAQ